MTTCDHGPGLLDAATIRRLRRAVLAWFDARRRDLPWRRDPTLYGTWISEMMLQQTTVAAVVPYWERFMARFPAVASLAAAPASEVLALWSGLGYYRRAHHLHAAARAVVADHGGELPHTVAGWRALPGVGAYAAGAIASIGLGLPVPAVDANVRRVVTRLIAADPDAAAALAPGHVDLVAANLVDLRRPGDWNQALMELGATVCRARLAACDECPARAACRAAGGHEPAAVGRLPQRPATVKVVTSFLLAHRDHQLLLLPTASSVVTRVRDLGRPLREDLRGLHTGLFSPPQTPWYAWTADADAGPALRAAWRTWLRRVGVPAASLRPVGCIPHAITHHAIRAEVFGVDLDAGGAAVLDLLDPACLWQTLREGSGNPPTIPLTAPARQCLILGGGSQQTR